MKHYLKIVFLITIITVTGCKNKTQKENIKTTNQQQVIDNMSSEKSEKEER